MNEAKTNLTLKQRRRMQGIAQPSGKQQGDGGRRELPLIAVILILLFAFGGGTALGMIWFRTDPRLQELDDMQAIAANENTPGDIRGELMGQRRELADQLPAELRQRAGMDWGGGFMADFFAKPAADQLAAMQKMVDWEKEREAEREARDAAKPADTSKDNSNNSNGSGRGGKNDQQRVQSMEQHLANRPPEQRAQGTLFHQMMNSVRQQN